MSNAYRLLILGAGPKAAALASKASVLEELGKLNVEVTVLDITGVAANWTGNNGFTNGMQLLGTAPEKDVGFPYPTSTFGPDTAKTMFKYSWGAYLSSKGDLSDWVDRGKPHPPHREWAAYLSWVFDGCGCRVVEGKLLKLRGAIDEEAGRLRLSAEIEPYDSSKFWKWFDGIVFTGPGDPIRGTVKGAEAGYIFDGRDYWHSAPQFERLRDTSIAVVGGGETAASIIVDLIQRVDASVKIDVVTRHPVLYSRGEGFQENRLYSRPDLWEQVEPEERVEFIRRTDRGVISVNAYETIGQASNIRTIYRSVESARTSGEVIKLTLRSVRDDNAIERSYSKVIYATGFDPFGPLRNTLTDNDLNPFIERESDDLKKRGDSVKRKIMDGIDTHLRLMLPNSEAGLRFNIHAPMLAASSQGPGFPNLSCLGILSDRILSAYL